jgi:hypothetical protein
MPVIASLRTKQAAVVPCPRVADGSPCAENVTVQMVFPKETSLRNPPPGGASRGARLACEAVVSTNIVMHT